MIPNAANCAVVAARLAAAAPAEVSVVDRHRDFAILAVQGTESDEVLAAAGFPTGHHYMSFAAVEHDAGPVTVCRTGYTGERGYELVIPTAAAEAVWDAVTAAGKPYGLQPAGLGARDTLRTEMGYPLHGQDISPSITPVQARLGWAVGWAKEAFFGAAALRAEKAAGPAAGAAGAEGGRPRDTPARHDGPLLDGNASWGWSPRAPSRPRSRRGSRSPCSSTDAADHTEVSVDIRTRQEPFLVTKPPFVTPGVREP